MHVPGLKLSGVRSYQGTSRSRLLLPKEEKDRSDTRLKDTSEPKKKDTSEPKKKTEVIVHPLACVFHVVLFLSRFLAGGVSHGYGHLLLCRTSRNWAPWMRMQRLSAALFFSCS